jgi:hypothetical protein
VAVFDSVHWLLLLSALQAAGIECHCKPQAAVARQDVYVFCVVCCIDWTRVAVCWVYTPTATRLCH